MLLNRGVVFSTSAILVMVMMAPLLVNGKCVITNLPTCDSKFPDGVVTSLVFNGTCEEKDEATLLDGGIYEVDINFTPKEDADYAKVMAQIKFGPLLIPEDVGNPDACEKKGLKCPLKADQHYTYHSVFHVTPMIHFKTDEHFTLLMYLLNEDSEQSHIGPIDPTKVIFCIQVHEVLKPRPPSPPERSALIEETKEQPSFRVVH